MTGRLTEEELGRTTGADMYFEIVIDRPNNLDRTVADIAEEAARLALAKTEASQTYNLNPFSIKQAVVAEIISQTFRPPEVIQ